MLALNVLIDGLVVMPQTAEVAPQPAVTTQATPLGVPINCRATAAGGIFPSDSTSVLLAAFPGSGKTYDFSGIVTPEKPQVQYTTEPTIPGWDVLDNTPEATAKREALAAKRAEAAAAKRAEIMAQAEAAASRKAQEEVARAEQRQASAQAAAQRREEAEAAKAAAKAGDAPTSSGPGIGGLPSFSAPSFSIPKLELPKVGLPVLELPGLSASPEAATPAPEMAPAEKAPAVVEEAPAAPVPPPPPPAVVAATPEATASDSIQVEDQSEQILSAARDAAAEVQQRGKAEAERLRMEAAAEAAAILAPGQAPHYYVETILTPHTSSHPPYVLVVETIP
mgnify:CR=1 FL=1